MGLIDWGLGSRADDDPYLITKQFWSDHRSKNTCHRIPECMHRNNTYINKSIDKAKLFNDYFCDQFSDPSKYDIDINIPKLSFNIFRIQKLLTNINVNKACGPDGIHGRGLNQKSAMISLCKIHIYIDSESFRQIR